MVKSLSPGWLTTGSALGVFRTMYTDDIVTKIYYISSPLPHRAPKRSNAYDIPSSTTLPELSVISHVSSERFILFPYTRCMTPCHQLYFVREYS